MKLRSVPRSPLVERLHLTARGGPQPSDVTMQVLRRYDLDGEVEQDLPDLLEKLDDYVRREPTAENIYSFAELSFLAGRQFEADDREEALNYYGISVAYAYRYLFDDALAPIRNPYDPQFRGACDLYNAALEASLRRLAEQGGLRPGSHHTVSVAGQTCDIAVVFRSGRWPNKEIERFEFATDFEVVGLTNQYRTYGLGVPLIAVRRAEPERQPNEEFYPPGLSIPLTAFLRVWPGNADTRRHGVLELYDPLVTTDTFVGNLRVPLESDLTTPLAYFLNDQSHVPLATLNLLHPGSRDELTGLFMVHPYEPGKIPVVMVHGLWSSPITWTEMFNDLLGSPEIRRNYQFWFYLYPTGQPFWISAAQMRTDLAHVRDVVDPTHREPALDDMVLVGHSMGGLVSRLQTIDSGDNFWRIVSDQPFQSIEADPATRQSLADVFYFRANPSIRRVITIGTPHRGSQFANDVTQWLSHKFITLPDMLVQRRQQLIRDNPQVIRDPKLLAITTSIDSLAPQSPVFPVMLASYHPPWVKYHNIVGVVKSDRLLWRLSSDGDGIVSYESAHTDDVESEIVVDADHIHIHSHPVAVLEVRRILLEHLRAVQTSPGYGARGVVPAQFHQSPGSYPYPPPLN